MALRSKLTEPDFDIPAGVPISTVPHRVNFHETDAMGIVHHANFVRFLEEARVQFIAEHHRPYTEYIAAGQHFAVTNLSCQFHRPARFDEVIEIIAALRWVRGASICFVYELRRDSDLLVSATTEHAMVSPEGRARRIPRETLQELIPLSIEGRAN